MESGELRGLARTHQHSEVLVAAFNGAADEIDRLEGLVVRYDAALKAAHGACEELGQAVELLRDARRIGLFDGFPFARTVDEYLAGVGRPHGGAGDGSP